MTLTHSLYRHPLTGLLLLTPLSIFAIYRGVAGRVEENAEKKRSHAFWMPWVTCGMLLAAIDGHKSLKAWDESKNWSSAHALTGALLLAGLAVQVTGSQFIDSTERSRDFHTYLGYAVTAILLAHVSTGVALLSDL